MNFLEKLIHWIMEHVQIVSYLININRHPTKPFLAKKGQGDPLSLNFLFVLTIEFLTRSLQRPKHHKEFHFYLRCSKLNLVQLGFILLMTFYYCSRETSCVLKFYLIYSLITHRILIWELTVKRALFS